MTFEEMWKSLEERDTTGKYKQAREMAELGMEQLEYAYNNGFADAKSKYERPQGEWIIQPHSMIMRCSLCENEETAAGIGIVDTNKHFCSNCGAKMKDGAE